MMNQLLPTGLTRRLLGGALALCGLLVDIVMGVLFFAEGSPLGLIGHIPAALLWSFGIFLMQAGDVTTPSAPTTRLRIVSGWAVAASICGICLFPGAGTTSCTIAFAVSYLLRQRPHAAKTSDLTMASMRVPAYLAQPATQRDLQRVRPLVDLLREENTELRRVVVKTLGDQGDNDSVTILRGLLSDANPDVRSDASVILTRLENDYNDAIHTAEMGVEEDPDDAELRLTLARLCYRFAQNGLLDEVSSRQYLVQAHEHFWALIEPLGYRVDLWVDLASVLYRLGYTADAERAIDHALYLRPEDADAYLVAVEIAFGEHQWEKLTMLANQQRNVPSETKAVLDWWRTVRGHSIMQVNAHG